MKVLNDIKIIDHFLKSTSDFDLSRLSEPVIFGVVSFTEAPETAKQYGNSSADGGLHFLFGLSPQRVHLHQVHT